MEHLHGREGSCGVFPCICVPSSNRLAGFFCTGFGVLKVPGAAADTFLASGRRSSLSSLKRSRRRCFVPARPHVSSAHVCSCVVLEAQGNRNSESVLSVGPALALAVAPALPPAFALSLALAFALTPALPLAFVLGS